MAQKWDYAELSKAAKAARGPEKYVELLEKASKDAGKMAFLHDTASLPVPQYLSHIHIYTHMYYFLLFPSLYQQTALCIRTTQSLRISWK